MNMVKLEMMVGTFMLIGILCLGYVSIKLGKLEIGGGDYYSVTASFDSVSGLKPGARVEVAGVEGRRLIAGDLVRVRAALGGPSVSFDCRFARGRCTGDEDEVLQPAHARASFVHAGTLAQCPLSEK